MSGGVRRTYARLPVYEYDGPLIKAAEDSGINHDNRLKNKRRTVTS